MQASLLSLVLRANEPKFNRKYEDVARSRFFRLKLSGTGNILKNFVNVIPPIDTSTAKILHPLLP